MPVKLFNRQEPLTCAHCGINLFNLPNLSIAVFVEDRHSGEVTDVYTCCKGQCDKILKTTRVGTTQYDD